jgi:predicted nucleotidyltransferase
MVSSAITQSIKQYLLNLNENGIPVSFGVLFGSYANGTANELSDIDLLVVSPAFDGTIERKKVHKLWHIAARTDSRIEPVPCGSRQWQTDNASPIIEIARTEGQTVLLS